MQIDNADVSEAGQCDMSVILCASNAERGDPELGASGVSASRPLLGLSASHQARLEISPQ
jgi:hypothetical protein